MTALLEVNHLGIQIARRGESRTILDDVTFTIEPGELLGLVGESGSGKSMTARAISRLVPDAAVVTGSIVVGGNDVLAMSPRELLAMRRDDVAMIFQDPRSHINPVRRVGDFLTEVSIRVDGTSKPTSTAFAIEALADVGIEDPLRVMNSYPHQVSGGMLQRVMIASAVLRQPSLLLADEPTTALDVTTQSEVMALLKDLCERRGMALLLITHDLELAAAVCRKIAVMYAGSIIESANARDMLATPGHPYTRALLDSRPDIQRRRTPLPAISGRPLAAFEAGPGCSFATRCAYVVPSCYVERPALLHVGAGCTRCSRTAELTGVLTQGQR